MLQCWQKRLLNNKPVVALEYTTAGSHSATLEAGTYLLTLVGSGGGAVSSRDDITDPHYWHWARGGVGGTIQVKVNIPSRTTIAISIGAVGTGSFQITTNATITATAGNQTSITGLPGATLVAGGGTGASLTIAGWTSTRTAGVQGSNTVSGANIKQILINNTNSIISTNGVNSNQGTPTRVDTGQLNINWSEDTQKGAGAGVGWANGAWNTTHLGKVGFVRIESA